MFSINNLKQLYPSGKRIQFANWHSNQGQHWLLSGNSGSGKTTLLQIISGLLKPTEGEVTIAGVEIYNLPASKADRFRGQTIGLVLQKPHLIDSINVMENLLLTQYLAGLRQDKERVKEVLTILQISDKEKSMPFALSQGEAQRVAIARAVLNKPAIIFADEPTASLDDVNTQKVISLLKGQATENNSTLVISTHDSRVKDHFEHVYHIENQAV